MIDGTHCKWCGRETKLIEDECSMCSDMRQLMERNLQDAAHMLSALFTKYNYERGALYAHKQKETH